MQSKPSLDYRIGFFSVLFAAFLWGTAGTAASFAKELSPMVIGTISVGVGGLIHTLLGLKAIRKNYQQLLPQKYQLLMGVVAAIACPITFYSSVALAGVSIGTVVSIGSAPLFSVILERIFEKRKLSFKWLMSFLIGILGIALLSHTEEIASGQASEIDRLTGIFFGILSGLSYAVYSWLVRNLINKGVDSRATMGVIFGICAVILIPTLFFTATNLFDYSVNIYVSIYIAFVPMFLGYLFFSFGLKWINASKAITLALFEPLVATVLAVFVVGEKLSYSNYFGLILIVSCIFILSKKES